MTKYANKMRGRVHELESAPTPGAVEALTLCAEHAEATLSLGLEKLKLSAIASSLEAIRDEARKALACKPSNPLAATAATGAPSAAGPAVQGVEDRDLVGEMAEVIHYFLPQDDGSWHDAAKSYRRACRQAAEEIIRRMRTLPPADGKGFDLWPLLPLLWAVHTDLGDWMRYSMAARNGEIKTPPTVAGHLRTQSLHVELGKAAAALHDHLKALHRLGPAGKSWYVQVVAGSAPPVFTVRDAAGNDYPKNQGVIVEASQEAAGKGRECWVLFYNDGTLASKFPTAKKPTWNDDKTHWRRMVEPPAVVEAASPAGELNICLRCGELNAEIVSLPNAGGDSDEGCEKCGGEEFEEALEAAFQKVVKACSRLEDSYFDEAGKVLVLKASKETMRRIYRQRIQQLANHVRRLKAEALALGAAGSLGGQQEGGRP
jgi:hypothetical protein